MQLREAIRRHAGVLQRRFWFLIISVSICTGSAFVVSLYLPPAYQTSALVMVNGAGSSGNDIYSNQALAMSYSLLVTRDDVLQVVASKLPGTSVEQLRQKVSDSPVSGTQIIEIRVQDSSAPRAALIANEIARTFIQLQISKETARLQTQQDQLAQNLLQAKSNLDMAQVQLANLQKTHASADAINQQRNLVDTDQSDYNAQLDSYHQLLQQKIQVSTLLSIIQQAPVPTQPVSPRIAINTLIAGLASLLMLAFLVLVLDWLDSTIYSGEDITRNTALDLLGDMPYVRSTYTQVPSCQLAVNSPLMEEAFIQIGTNIGVLNDDRSTFLVTSMRDGSGVSTASANLAHVIALSGLRVLLVDANLERPSLYEMFACTNAYGLANCLTDIQGIMREQPLGIVHSWLDQWRTHIPNLWLLPAGSSSLKIRTPELKLFVAWLLEGQQGSVMRAIDIIIFDGPPFGKSADALALASVVDASLLVIEAGKEQTEALGKVQRALMRLDSQVAGVIVNRRRARACKMPMTQRRTAMSEQQEQLARSTKLNVPVAQSLPSMPPRLPETPSRLERIISSELLKQTSLIGQTVQSARTAVLPAMSMSEETIRPDGVEEEKWQLSPRFRGISLPGLSTEGNSGALKLSYYRSQTIPEESGLVSGDA